jgi:hypothetical protein
MLPPNAIQIEFFHRLRINGTLPTTIHLNKLFRGNLGGLRHLTHDTIFEGIKSALEKILNWGQWRASHSTNLTVKHPLQQST